MENQMLDFDPQAVCSTYFLDIHPVSDLSCKWFSISLLYESFLSLICFDKDLILNTIVILDDNTF